LLAAEEDTYHPDHAPATPFAFKDVNGAEDGESLGTPESAASSLAFGPVPRGEPSSMAPC
jgi:hypothetical protein